jgi:2-polyprenyl-3-methyl-5-hydroxy-6-metoxy-1,4-benzoquinol methylase
MADADDVAVQVRQLFDAKAATWPAKYAARAPLAGRLEHLAAAVDRYVRPKGKVLDLGCGTGELARRMAACGLHVTGCDISSQMLGHAMATDPGGAVAWIQLQPNWHTLPFQAGAFDAVIASSVIEYVDHPLGVLQECARLLSPGGVVLCTAPNLAHPVRWLEWMAAHLARPRLVGLVRGRSRRLDSYVVYLGLSRQRHWARWWSRTGAQAGLTLLRTAAMARRSPLRLLVLESRR